MNRFDIEVESARAALDQAWPTFIAAERVKAASLLERIEHKAAQLTALEAAARNSADADG
jgi:hypothetical protein